MLFGQQSITINGSIDPETRTIKMGEDVVFTNTSQDTLSEIYFNDWANSFSEKRTELGKRFEANYDRSFHLAKERVRGNTFIERVTNETYDDLKFDRPDGIADVLRVTLRKPLLPGQSVKVRLFVQVKLPDSKFTGYGAINNGDYNLRFWYLSPAVYDGKWHYYSNKDLDDLYALATDFDITLSVPKEYEVITELDKRNNGTSYVSDHHIISLNGEKRTNATIYLRQISNFESVTTDNLEVVTNIVDSKVSQINRVLIIDKITSYLNEELGNYPFDKLLISQLDYKENPVYGLNQLPDFLSPFPDDFLYELKILKTTINDYVDNALIYNPRDDRWVADAIKINLMMRYMDEYYPKVKVLGNLTRFWVVRQFNLSKVEFNDQFPLLYLHMARLNLDQPLTQPYDSLIKFNKNIGNPYKGGAGLKYLEDYVDGDVVNNTIKEYYADNVLKPTSSSKFEEILRENISLKAKKNATPQDLDWFFNEYINTRQKIDYKFNEVKERGDSIYLTIKNKRETAFPIPVYGMKKDSIVSKKWINGFKKDTTIAIASQGVDRVALNAEGIVPEYNRRDNYKKVHPFLFKKPIQFKLLQDIEDPSKDQVFFMPIVEYNYYDGIQLGINMYNKTVLTKAFNYSIEPIYGFKSGNFSGGGGIRYTQNIEEGNLYAIRYGFGGSSSSYAPDAYYRKFTPYITFGFRTDDYRSDKRQFLSISSINVSRDESNLIVNDDPNYSVFNVNYENRNPGVIKSLNWSTNFQLAQKFSKISMTARYRKLFLNNRYLDLRLYAGSFIFNDSRSEGDYFSFALDRPTDYLFNYNYYGRSENSGIFSQQLILAEGGFKSKLDTPFANQWIATVNASTTIWNFLHAYGDIGFVHNKQLPTEFVYDSGIRASLVEDYFELFFPVYSSNGWEIAQPDYDQKIRFIVTLDLRTLLGLFTRKWY